jgi:hypothetical protein
MCHDRIFEIGEEVPPQEAGLVLQYVSWREYDWVWSVA